MLKSLKTLTLLILNDEILHQPFHQSNMILDDTISNLKTIRDDEKLE